MVQSDGLICTKIKLKNFPEPETAGGCGVVPFLSAKDLFCRHITIPAQRYNSDLLYLVTKLGLLLKG